MKDYYGGLVRVQFYLHPEELSALQRAVYDSGIPLSTFLRMNLLTILKNRGYQVETRKKLGNHTISGISSSRLAGYD